LRIDSSQIAFQSESSKSSSSTRTETEINSFSRQALGNGDTDISHIKTGTEVDISYAARMRSMHSVNSQSLSTVTSTDDVIEHQRATSLASIVSHVIGKDAHIEKSGHSLNSAQRVSNQTSLAVQQYTAVEDANPVSDSSSQLQISNGQLLEGQAITAEMLSSINVSGFDSDVQLELIETRLDIHETHLYQENEQMRFSSQGTLTTEDGRQIDFMLELDMERSFELEESFEMNRTDRRIVDPLVINLHGGAAELTSTSFRFDLDGDGFEEEISSVTGGTGFLALDSNNDGVINNGTELFGTQGMDGFSDLARHDSDGNMWIDENDAIFTELKVWTRDAEGNDQLTSLKDAGVGAIYLGSSASNFDLKDSENNLLGTVKRSGVFLSEDGQVASIQELDLAIHAEDINSIMVREGHAIAVSPGAGQNIGTFAASGGITQSAFSAPELPDSAMAGSSAEGPLFVDQQESTLKLDERYASRLAYEEHSIPPFDTERMEGFPPEPFTADEAGATAMAFEPAATVEVRKSESTMTEAVQARSDSTSTSVQQTDETDDSSNDKASGDAGEVVRKFFFDEHRIDIFRDLNQRTEEQNSRQASSLSIMKETIAQMRAALAREHDKR